MVSFAVYHRLCSRSLKFKITGYSWLLQPRKGILLEIRNYSISITDPRGRETFDNVAGVQDHVGAHVTGHRGDRLLCPPGSGSRSSCMYPSILLRGVPRENIHAANMCLCRLCTLESNGMSKTSGSNESGRPISRCRNDLRRSTGRCRLSLTAALRQNLAKGEATVPHLRPCCDNWVDADDP